MTCAPWICVILVPPPLLLTEFCSVLCYYVSVPVGQGPHLGKSQITKAHKTSPGWLAITLADRVNMETNSKLLVKISAKFAVIQIILLIRLWEPISARDLKPILCLHV